jgi:hypothetical protein
MKAGNLDHTYQYRRNVIDIVPGDRYRRVADASMASSAVARRVDRMRGCTLPPYEDLHDRFTDHGQDRVDLRHFAGSSGTVGPLGLPRTLRKSSFCTLLSD